MVYKNWELSCELRLASPMPAAPLPTYPCASASMKFTVLIPRSSTA